MPEETRSMSDRAIDAAATIGRVQSYFSIAISTLVLTFGARGRVQPLRERDHSVRRRGDLDDGAPPAFDGHGQGVARPGGAVAGTQGVVSGDPVCTGTNGATCSIPPGGSARAEAPATQIKFTLPEDGVERVKAFTVARAVMTSTNGTQTETRVNPRE